MILDLGIGGFRCGPKKGPDAAWRCCCRTASHHEPLHADGQYPVRLQQPVLGQPAGTAMLDVHLEMVMQIFTHPRQVCQNLDPVLAKLVTKARIKGNVKAQRRN